MNTYLILILVILIGRYLLQSVTDILNTRHAAEKLPGEFESWYDADKYRKSQQYLKDTTRFGLVQDTIMTGITIAFILLGGFVWLNQIAQSTSTHPVWAGLTFTGLLILLSKLVHLPFDLYDTFVLEDRYGFNRTTPKTFILDQIKTIALTVIIGGPIYALVLWFFQSFEQYAWLFAWVAVVLFQFILMFLAPVVIMPLFNKFTPLEDGELKESIEGYAQKQKFKMKGIFTMDGSKRSAKSNAFFTGFGASKRIALFDTLIENHTVAELTAVVAHEMGHYKKKHILQAIIRSIITSGIMFYLLSLFLKSESLYAAFGLSSTPVYAGLVFFGFLYTPLSMVLSLIENIISRKHEFEADGYAVETYGHADAMIDALKKLSVDNLSNLTPHPFKVFMEYSHPPVLQRIAAIRKQS